MYLLHPTFPSHVALIIFDIVYSMEWYKTVVQHFFVVYHGISHLSIVLSWYTHFAKRSCVYQENKGDLWGIQHYYAYHSKVLQNNYVTYVISLQGHISQNYRLLRIANWSYSSQQLFKSTGNLRIPEINWRLSQPNKNFIFTTALMSPKDIISCLKKLKCTYNSL